MVFSSPVFLFLFLPITLAAVLLVRREWRNGVLLIASLVFYAWGEAEFVLVMLVSITGNYFFGLLIDRYREQGQSKRWVAVAVAFNLLLLSLFKYANFLADNFNTLLGLAHLPPLTLGPIHLPVGISFFTFQAMSYILDVYRRDAPAAKNPADFALYISLFPQLIAGPIVRYLDVAQQILSRTVTPEKFASGVRRFIIGLGKKVLIAGVMTKVADGIFGLPTGQLNFWLAWTGITAFSLQVYFDFSAYSDMAIGLGRMLGFEFKENFNYPFIAQSIREFWRRWHISLSTWFRDYLYIPLGGNRRSNVRTYFNLFTVFLLCGLWHGASWTFVMMGALFGAFLVLERLGWEALLQRLWRPVRHVYALAAIAACFVFFRAQDFPSALAFLKNMFWLAPQKASFPLAYFLTPEALVFGVLAIAGSLPVWPWVRRELEHRPLQPWLRGLGNAAYFGFLLVILLLSVMSMASGTYQAFIYFQF
jgi:alginate O-acetyltransferase complex protein AlgI